jgi:hypothetical protein
MKRVTFPLTRLGAAGSAGEVEPESLTDDSVEAAMDFDPDELREFLAADLVDVPIDPAFKLRLRSKLWHMVRFRYRRGSDRQS